MKRTAAFILSIVYMAFTFSSLGYSHGNAVYTHAVSNAVADCNDADDASDCEAHFDATGQFKKTPKHPAPSGKIKVPRPATWNDSYSIWQSSNLGLASSFPYASSIWTFPTTDLYLKNRVLLI